MKADIKIWILTGDKQETAINIGKPHLSSENSSPEELAAILCWVSKSCMGDLCVLFSTWSSDAAWDPYRAPPSRTVIGLTLPQHPISLSWPLPNKTQMSTCVWLFPFGRLCNYLCEALQPRSFHGRFSVTWQWRSRVMQIHSYWSSMIFPRRILVSILTGLYRWWSQVHVFTAVKLNCCHTSIFVFASWI